MRVYVLAESKDTRKQMQGDSSLRVTVPAGQVTREREAKRWPEGGRKGMESKGEMM